LSAKVREVRADVGVALDGDADRVVIVDEKGHVIDGDQLMAVIAGSWKEDGRLTKDGVVATIMSNLGFERHLKALGLSLSRTPVGDRYVLEHMREHGFNLGGEQSGHIILSDYATTGDGLVAALQVLAVVKRQNRPVSNARLNGNGRLVIRRSGTEPVIRVMGEGDDQYLVEEVVDEIVEALTQAAA
jgi:phosphoglucosamine mutase